MLENIELFLYRRARAIVPVSGAFKTDLIARGIDARKISVITNGADLTRFTSRPRDRALAAKHKIEGKFIIGYIGTHGMAHALDRVIDAAELLGNHQRIHFVFVGGGAAKEEIEAKAKRLALTNVTFLPPQPKESMPAYWSLCDVALIPLKNTPVFANVIPSKMFEAMAMGIPQVMAIPKGEATGILETAGAGICVAPEDPQALASVLSNLADNRKQWESISESALKNAPRFDRAHLARRMSWVLQIVARRR